MQLNLTGCSIALLAALVANYTVSLSDVTNNASVTIISGSYLQYSVSLFGGIFFTLTLLTAIYHIMWIIVRHLNFGCINNNPKIFGIIVSASNVLLEFFRVCLYKFVPLLKLSVHAS